MRKELIFWPLHGLQKSKELVLVFHVCSSRHLKDVQADVAVDVDVRVEAGGLELDLGRLERVIVGEGEGELVDHPLVDGVLAPCDGAFPAEDVVPLWKR